MNEVTQPVEVTVAVGVGNRYNIHDSYAFAGIEEGTVEVTDIIKYGDVNTTSEEVASLVDTQVGIWVDNEMLTQEQADATPWVVYKDNNGEHYTLPINVFVDHTTTL